MNDRIFYCYSLNLKNFLVANGEEYVSKEIHKKTNKMFWCFLGTENFNNLLATWRSNRKIKY